jgi:DNA-binding NtrC family response regulator
MTSRLLGYSSPCGDGARGGESAEEHGSHIADALRNQLHIRIVPVARHAVRHHTGQQRLDARSINVDIRVLSATNIDLETSLAQGRLRRDLFYRLASVTLRLPPLRDRQSDIPILVDYYIKQFSKSWLIEPPHLSASVLGALCNHDWPGNIRELRNVVSRLLLHSLDGAVTGALVRKTLHGTTFPVRRQNPRSSSRYPHQPKFHYRRLPGEMTPICQALRKMNVPIFWRHYASLGGVCLARVVLRPC